MMRSVLLFFLFVAGPTILRPVLGAINWSEPGRMEAVEDRLTLTAEEASIDLVALRRALPRGGEKLLRGEPFTLLAIGDSVTATGPYPEILAGLLTRATVTASIRVERAAFAGRSVDAAVRRWERDIAPAGADLALILFGLNDQAAGSPLAAYLEQTRWLVERLRAQGADVVLLEPTPHINITPLPTDKAPPPPEASIFRTVVFAAALRELGRELDAPVAPTFDAIWGEGGADLQAAARAMWPLFPAHYSKPFTTLVETGGRGDTIHPNAAGHARIARAVFDTIGGRAPAPALQVTAMTEGGADGRLVSRLRLKNASGRARAGSLALYPFTQDERHERLGYALDIGETGELVFVWPETARPGLFLHLQAVDYHGDGSRAFAFAAPLRPDARWLRERVVVAAPRAVARFETGGGVRETTVAWPEDSELGRVPISETIASGEGSLGLGAELAYVRFAAAASGDIEADGDLAEWVGARWVPVGEPVQARWTRGPADHRAERRECYLHWAFRAGRDGVGVAFRATGEIERDTFTLYFDPRPSDELGTVGPYFWIDGRLRDDGLLALRAGDSSPSGVPGLTGRWRRIGPGEFEGELFVPYALMGADAWPAGGDLGASIVWAHRHADDRVTRLMWAENGHPWNTRWFGVVRRDPEGPLPWRVRVE